MNPSRPERSDLLLEIWRSVAQAEELAVLAERTLGTLASEFPASSLTLYRLETERSLLRPIAFASRLPAIKSTRSGTRELQDLQSFLEWCRREVIDAVGSAEAPGISGSGRAGLRLCGPLGVQGRALGMVEWELDAGHALSAAESDWAQALLEPLAVALANQERMRELSVSKEVAEADRRSLLSRLGRDELRETIVGASSGLKEVLERVQLVARTDAPVLLLGETGSGKEVVARALHEGSQLAAHPFLRVNCGAIPPQLIDSELFGHERGSFTGANQTRLGWFERAHRGTLFLDEVAELPLEAQVRLLRVLQDGTFERVGGQTTIKVEVRIVAATHQDLSEMVRAGSFRRDLWYRISVFPISIPPLRERREDLPGMALHFAQKSSRKLGLAFQAPTPEDIDALLSYPWPGNVREFAAVMERAVILGKGQRLEIAVALGLGAPARAATTSAPLPPPARQDSPDRAAIERAMAVSRGRVEGPFGAAAALGLAAHVLRARLRRFGIDWRSFRGAP
ncbi:MAG TPA: sigma-54 dependent transcriptional regulator [Planctomycetota bacterium]|nr:sigma-54 dependent transcriptional regulator [Planctomycetota bacterium]